MVLSWNEKTGEREYKEVTELFLHEVELLYEVRIQRPLDGSPLTLVDETILETTWNHPFRRLKTDDREQKERKPEDSEWVEARYLNTGDILILSSGKEVAISGIRSYNVEATKVYNFEVADNHTYFVGEDGVLVHNYLATAGTPPSISEQVFNSIVSGAISTVDVVRSGLGYTADILNMPADLLASGSEWLSNQGALGAIASTALNIPTGLLRLGTETLASPLTLLSNDRDFSGFGQGWDSLILGIQNGSGYLHSALNYPADTLGKFADYVGHHEMELYGAAPIHDILNLPGGLLKVGSEMLSLPARFLAHPSDSYNGKAYDGIADGWNQLGLGSNTQGILGNAWSGFNSLVETPKDYLIGAGESLFGHKHDLLGDFKNNWSNAGIAGKFGLAMASPFIYAGHVGLNTMNMIGGSLMQPGAPLDYTWGLPGSLAGTAFGLANILAGGTAVANNGAVETRSALFMDKYGGISLGPYTFGGTKFKKWGHEFGHSQQNRVLGPAYFPVIGLPSIISAENANNSSHDHHSHWTETWADEWGIQEYERRNLVP